MVPLDAHARLLPDPAHSRKGNLYRNCPGRTAILDNVFHDTENSRRVSGHTSTK